MSERRLHLEYFGDGPSRDAYVGAHAELDDAVARALPPESPPSQWDLFVDPRSVFHLPYRPWTNGLRALQRYTWASILRGG